MSGKIVWTLVRKNDVDAASFAEFSVKELARGAAELVGHVTDVSIILQEPGAFSRSEVNVRGAPRSVDAILSISTSDAFPALDEVNAYLESHCDHVQGWLTKPTLIFDSSKRPAPGSRSALPHVCCFITRLDGTSEEHFHRNWFIHAGHLDGREEASAQSLLEREREEKAVPGWAYVQNRFREAVTPTSWVAHGFTDLVMSGFIPDTGEPYERVRGEAPFEKWPPRIIQGYEHRLDLNVPSTRAARKIAGGVAVVIGGAGTGAGLGRGLVQSFADAGMHVAILDRDEAAAVRFAGELRERGLAAFAMGVDVTDPASLRAAADAVGQRFGTCNVLCAHVGGGGQGRFDDLDLSTWRETFEVMALGTVASVQAFLPLMRATPGYRRILLTSSVAALAPGRFQGPYRAAKAAVTSIGETLSAELSSEGIGTTIVFPSGMGDAAMVALAAQARAEGGVQAHLAADPVIGAIAEELGGDPTDICTGLQAAAPVLAAMLREDPYVITHGRSVLNGFTARQREIAAAVERLSAREFLATSPVVEEVFAISQDGPPSATMPIGELLDDPMRRAVLDRHLPGFSDNPQMQLARAFTLSSIRPFAPNDLTDEVIAAIDGDLLASS